MLADDEGELAGLIDFGELRSGDLAVDLQFAWTLFDTAGRASFTAAVGRDEPDEHHRRTGGASAVKDSGR